MEPFQPTSEPEKWAPLWFQSTFHAEVTWVPEGKSHSTSQPLRPAVPAVRETLAWKPPFQLEVTLYSTPPQYSAAKAWGAAIRPTVPTMATGRPIAAPRRHRRRRLSGGAGVSSSIALLLRAV